jgi:hypothetical protein
MFIGLSTVAFFPSSVYLQKAMIMIIKITEDINKSLLIFHRGLDSKVVIQKCKIISQINHHKEAIIGGRNLHNTTFRLPLI